MWEPNALISTVFFLKSQLKLRQLASEFRLLVLQADDQLLLSFTIQPQLHRLVLEPLQWSHDDQTTYTDRQLNVSYRSMFNFSSVVSLKNLVLVRN